MGDGEGQARVRDAKRDGPWLGPCPDDWPLTTLKRVGRFRAGAGFPDAEQGIQDGELPYYKISDMNADGNAVSMDEAANTVSRRTADRLGASVFEPDTIIFPKVGAALLSNKRRMITRPSCADNNTMGLTVAHGVPKYFFYLLSCLDLGLLANPGAVPSVNESQLREIRVCAPDDRAQRDIADFLDRETEKIDALVAKKRQLIDLLQEKRTALISHAVTKGVDRGVPLKDSGHGWLGEVPDAWQVVQLRHACSVIRDGTHQPPARVADGYPLLSVRNIVDGRLVNLADDSMISREDYLDLTRSLRVQTDDVAMAIVGATLGKIALVPEMPPFAIQRSLAVFRVRPRLVTPRFLASFLASAQFQSTLWANAGFSAQPGIYLGTLASFPVALPPLAEQRAIVEFVDRGTLRIDSLIAKVTEAVDRLLEYRSALITADRHRTNRRA